MIFSSLLFIFYFLPAVLALYYLVREDMRNYVLLLASFVFYAWGEPEYCILMFAIIVVNYFAALLIDVGGAWRTICFVLALLADFGALCFCKYMDFLIDNFNALFHGQVDLLHIALPIGISFYIFQSVSYVFDVYRKETAPQRDFFKLLLFISFFPQMIAGPILKYHDMEMQLNRRSVSMPLFAYGVKRFIAGLAKKILIADTLSVVADRLLENGGSYFPGWCAWIGVAAYTFQIYYDFSGYSDMAIGLGQMFGFRILENFNYPYISRSITDFWRRWHISLSTWFKEYVYIPLGGNRVSKARNLCNLFIVFVLTGIWHGAAWNFVLWGLWHGLFIMLEKITGFHKKQFGVIGAAIQHIYTIGIFYFGWILFREETIDNAWLIVKRMFGVLGSDHVLYSGLQCCTLIETLTFAAALLCAVPLFRKWITPPEPTETESVSAKQGIGTILCNAWLLVLFVLAVSRIAAGSQSPFIYFRF